MVSSASFCLPKPIPGRASGALDRAVGLQEEIVGRGVGDHFSNKKTGFQVTIQCIIVPLAVDVDVLAVRLLFVGGVKAGMMALTANNKGKFELPFCQIFVSVLDYLDLVIDALPEL